MKKENNNILAIVLTILLGVIMNSLTSGARTNGHYMGLVMVCIILFFIVKWLLGMLSESDVIKEIKAEKEIKEKIQDSISNYNEARNSFKYFSNANLINLYEQKKLEGSENMERLALEEELVERGLIEYSPMHEKLYLLKKKFLE